MLQPDLRVESLVINRHTNLRLYFTLLYFDFVVRPYRSISARHGLLLQVQRGLCHIISYHIINL